MWKKFKNWLLPEKNEFIYTPLPVEEPVRKVTVVKKASAKKSTAKKKAPAKKSPAKKTVKKSTPKKKK